MKQITVRGIDSDLDRALMREASRRGMSMNRFVLSVLRRALGLDNGEPAGPVEYHDLDHLAGTWTQEEWQEFDQELTRQRSIDEDLWR